jgi:hypothetical protein
VYFTSGSFPRFPIRMTLLMLLPAIFADSFAENLVRDANYNRIARHQTCADRTSKM